MRKTFGPIEAGKTTALEILDGEAELMSPPNERDHMHRNPMNRGTRGLMSTVLVAVTAIDAAGAELLLDTLAAVFPVSAFRGSPNVWVVEVEQAEEAGLDEAEGRVRDLLDAIDDHWEAVLSFGARSVI